MAAHCNTPDSVVGDEVLFLLTCFVLGFAAYKAIDAQASKQWPDNKVSKSNASHRSRSSPFGADASSFFEGLPLEIAAEVACLVDLCDVASLAAVSPAAKAKFWQASEVWSVLGRARGLPRPNGAAGAAVRESFRQIWFRVDCRALRALGSAAPGTHGTSHVAILGEAAHVVRGLMPADGATITEGLCKVAERALQGHDPENKDAGEAAELFLHAARRRVELLSGQQMERLEGAYNSALQLQELMEVTMQDHLDQFEVPGFYTDSPASSPAPSTVSLASLSLPAGLISDSDFSNLSLGRLDWADSRSQSSRSALPSASSGGASHRSESPFSSVQSADAGLDRVHDEQRAQQLDAMLEELHLTA